MEKRYLINNKVYQGSDVPCYNEKIYSSMCNFNDWKRNLIELNIDEVELFRVLHNINDNLIHNDIIDITSITTVKDGKVYFKDVEMESWDTIYLKYINENPNYKEPFCLSITEWLKLNYNTPTLRNI